MSKEKIVFGAVAGVSPGMRFDSYAELNRVGVHRSKMGGISGRQSLGADSIVISGGYEDDEDHGDMVVYTGQGGRDSSGKQSEDQLLHRGNLALAKSQLDGLPVRVIRGQDKNNAYAPAKGYRYDGLYRVESHWHEPGRSGFRVWRFRLEKMEDSCQPPPLTAHDKALSTGNSSPKRIVQTVQRIVRDTLMSRQLKRLYQNRCQVCNIVIGFGDCVYAEAAHIRPLGRPHEGPDTAENLLCLCPNHHVMFDLGHFSISDDFSLIGLEGVLHVHPQHRIQTRYLQYHRERFLSPPGQ